jgi:hypothetical protein
VHGPSEQERTHPALPPRLRVIGTAPFDEGSDFPPASAPPTWKTTEHRYRQNLTNAEP